MAIIDYSLVVMQLEKNYSTETSKAVDDPDAHSRPLISSVQIIRSWLFFIFTKLSTNVFH